MNRTLTSPKFNLSIANFKRNFEERLLSICRGLILPILFTNLFQNAEGATITSTTTGGSWNATTTWVGGVIPNFEDEVVVESGALVNINQHITCAGLTVLGNLSTDGANRSVTINGALTIHGSFDLYRCSPLTVTGNTTIYGTLSDTHNSGSAIFEGLLTIADGGSFVSTTNSAFTFHNGITNNGTFNKTGIGLVLFSTNAQQLDGTNPLYFEGAVTIGSGVVLTNHNITILTGVLDGTDNNSIWVNATNGTLDYRNGTTLMTTGTLNASAPENTVIYNADADQTIKVTNYHHLQTGANSVTNIRTKTFENSIGTITIAGNLVVGDSSIFNLGLGNKSILVDGNVTLETPNTWLRTANTDNAIHELTIGGVLQINGGEVRLRYLGTSRYCDLTMTGSGNIIQGNGTLFYLRNLTLTNPDAKQSTYSDNINFYSGSNSPNQFINNGGSFTSSAGNIIFRDDNVEWSVGGTGAITFANLQIGANTRTNVTLNRDVTVENILNLYHYAAANYLDLNGYTLILNGDHIRQGSGRIRGGGTSALIINGTGDFTDALYFDQTTPDTTNHLAQLNYNRNGMMLLANLLSIDLLNIQQGTLNAASGSIQVNQSANLINGQFMDDKNSGTNAFSGITTISETSAFEATANSILYLSGAIHNHGTFLKSGTGKTIFTDNTTLNGQAVYQFINGNITINSNVEVINNASAYDLGVQIDGQLNGADNGSQWKNRGILVYRNASQPMSTGILDASETGNTVAYSLYQNSQEIKGATYHHLQLNNSGLRMLMNDITVNGNISLGKETALHTEAFQITGNPTGSFTTAESSELQIGDGISFGPNFPTGFTRENIIFDVNSQVTYNGTTQPVSHVPVYANLSIKSDGDKTITGDVTVNGNLTISAGTGVNPSEGLRLLAGSHLTVNGNMDIADASDLILESETGADKLASLITNGNVTGTANIKLTLPANQWFYVASPIQSPTFGNFDTGTDGARVYVHRGEWFSTNASHVEVPLQSMEGVLVKYDGLKTLDYDGELNAASYISRTYDTPGWYLMGNPYPCFINWQENAGWSRPNIDNTIWYRTFDGSHMVFITYNRAAASGAKVAFYPSGQSLNNDADLANIPPMQSVWVKALAATTISVKSNARNHGVAGSQLKTSTTGGNADIIRITADNGLARDGVVIYFSEETTNGMDAGDSEKRFNDSQAIPELFTRIGSTAAAINGLPMLSDSSQTIPLIVLNKVPDAVTLHFDMALYQSHQTVYLEDKTTGQMVNLMTNPDYTYTPSVVGEAHERFTIRIGYSATVTSISNTNKDTTTNHDITITGIDGQALVRISSNHLKTHHAHIEVYTTDGRKVSDTTTRVIETLINLPKIDAVFVVKVTVGDAVKTEKVTGKK